MSKAWWLVCLVFIVAVGLVVSLLIYDSQPSPKDPRFELESLIIKQLQDLDVFATSSDKRLTIDSIVKLDPVHAMFVGRAIGPAYTIDGADSFGKKWTARIIWHYQNHSVEVLFVHRNEGSAIKDYLYICPLFWWGFVGDPNDDGNVNVNSEPHFDYKVPEALRNHSP